MYFKMIFCSVMNNLMLLCEHYDYSHKILPPLPSFLPESDNVFTTHCHEGKQYIKSPTESI